MFTLEGFFKSGKNIAERYNETKDVLETEIGQKEIAKAIEDKLSNAILSIDTDKLNASIDMDTLPSFGFNNEQKQEMIKDICQTIRTEQYTLGDFINAKTERIDVIKETLVGGVEELFDENSEEYRYKKELEEERRNTLLIAQQISQMAENREKMPDDMREIIDTNDDIKKVLNFEVPVRTYEEKLTQLKAALTAVAIMETTGVHIDTEKSSQNFAEIRVGIDNGENTIDRLQKDFAQTFEDVKNSFPDMQDRFENIKESFFEDENKLEIDTSQVQQVHEEDDEILID